MKFQAEQSTMRYTSGVWLSKTLVFKWTAKILFDRSTSPSLRWTHILF